MEKRLVEKIHDKICHISSTFSHQLVLYQTGVILPYWYDISMIIYWGRLQTTIKRGDICWLSSSVKALMNAKLSAGNRDKIWDLTSAVLQERQVFLKIGMSSISLLPSCLSSGIFSWNLTFELPLHSKHTFF